MCPLRSTLPAASTIARHQASLPNPCRADSQNLTLSDTHDGQIGSGKRDPCARWHPPGGTKPVQTLAPPPTSAGPAPPTAASRSPGERTRDDSRALDRRMSPQPIRAPPPGRPAGHRPRRAVTQPTGADAATPAIGSRSPLTRPIPPGSKRDPVRGWPGGGIAQPATDRETAIDDQAQHPRHTNQSHIDPNANGGTLPGGWHRQAHKDGRRQHAWPLDPTPGSDHCAKPDQLVTNGFAPLGHARSRCLSGRFDHVGHVDAGHGSPAPCNSDLDTASLWVISHFTPTRA